MPACTESTAAAGQRKTTEAPLLKLTDLTVGFSQYGTDMPPALRSINLSIERGEVLGLVGESGSGKTVLSRTIMNLIPPPGRIESGKLEFEGRDLTALPPDEMRALRGREIAMIISNPKAELDPMQTIGAQIGNVLRAHTTLSRRAVRARALELLQQVSIPAPERRLAAYAHELSGGMAQRVVMAIALACSPKLIISDDATSGLDVTVQAQVLDLMRVLVVDRGTSLLFITRDIGIAAHFCDRVAVIYAGQIVEQAARNEFFENPQHPYSILLLAAFAQNERLRHYWLGEATAQHDNRVHTSGCPFAARCVRAQSRCHEEIPATRMLNTEHYIRCHFPVER